jgi:type VI secretion system protein ImpE
MEAYVTAEEHLRGGRLQEALKELQSEIKKKPADSRLRVFLFQVLAVTGEWDRALTQLEVAAGLNADALAMKATYQDVLRCEAQRKRIFAGHGTPLIFGEPAEWIALLVQALRLTAEERFDEAARLRDLAFEGAPTTSGQIDGQPFEWIADADSRIGPMLEAIMDGRYYWIPFMRLRSVKIEKPVDLRDVAWTPATVTFVNGGEKIVMIPTRYPGSEAAADPRVVLARLTEWTERPADAHLGLGQRLLATDAGEFPLMDVRSIDLASPSSEATPANPI